MKTLELIARPVVNHLTSSSALSLVYDERPLAHTVLYINEANQMQSDENSTFAMLLPASSAKVALSIRPQLRTRTVTGAAR